MRSLKYMILLEKMRIKFQSIKAQILHVKLFQYCIVPLIFLKPAKISAQSKYSCLEKEAFEERTLKLNHNASFKKCKVQMSWLCCSFSQKLKI